jgi:regulator of nonsense transcripts 2
VREKKLKDAKSAFEKMIQHAESLADALDRDFPELPKEEDDMQDELQGISLYEGEVRAEGDLEGPFDDEDTRDFYMTLPELQAMVPPSLLGIQPKAAMDPGGGATEDATEPDSDDAPSIAEAAAEAAAEETKAEAAKADTEPTEEASSGANDDDEDLKPHHQVEMLLGTMEDLVNRDRVDKFAVDFCSFNSKSSRRRLVKALFSVPRQSLELIPNYARLAATLSLKGAMKDIGDPLVQMLLEEFNWLLRKKNQYRLETKLRNVRFIAELTKFNVAPPQITFQCLKRTLDDFTGHNIEMCTTLLENCGRYLYRQPHTHVRLANCLEIMMRLKQVKSLDSNAENLIANAYYQVKPPERAKKQQKEYPVMYRYVRKLMLMDLKKGSAERVLKTLRRLPWDDPTTEDYVLKCALKVTKHRHLPHVCDVLAGLNRWHSSLSIRVIDAVLEVLQRGLETNNFREQQTLIAYTRFLGELYNYSVVNSVVVFDVLYKFIETGHQVADQYMSEHQREYKSVFAGKRLVYDPRVPTPTDSDTDLFRVRQVTELLLVCGHYFDKGIAKQRLDRFLTWFQRYLITKPVIPSSVEFAVLDLLEDLRPKLHFFDDWEEAQTAIELVEKKDMVVEAKSKAAAAATEANAACGPTEEGMDVEDNEEDDEEDDVQDDGDDDVLQENEEDRMEIGDIDGDESDDSQDGEEGGEQEVPEEDDDVILNEPLAQDEVDEDFEKELKKMMLDAGGEVSQATAAAVTTNTDELATLPMRRVGTTRKDEEEAEPQQGKVVFRLVKRGSAELYLNSLYCGIANDEIRPLSRQQGQDGSQGPIRPGGKPTRPTFQNERGKQHQSSYRVALTQRCHHFVCQGSRARGA